MDKGRSILVLRFRGKRREITLDPAIGEFDVEERKNKAAPPAIAKHGEIPDRNPGDLRLFMTKPAPRRQEARCDRALEGDAFSPGKDRFELTSGNQRKKPWRHMLVVAVLGFLGRLEPEPEETRGRQCQKIGTRIDRREETAGSKLDGHGTLEFGEIELNRLRRPRHIGDAENPLALEFAKIDQDFPVRWMKEAQRASPE